MNRQEYPDETVIRSFSELRQYQLDPQAAAALDIEFCLQHHVAILGLLPSSRSEPVKVGMLDPRDPALIEELEKRLGRRIQPVQLNAYEIRSAIAKIYNISLDEDQNLVVTLDAKRKIEFGEGQPASKIVDDMLAVAVRQRASDVHVEVFNGDIDLRFRIDGVLVQVTTPISPDNVQKVLSRIKVLANLDIVERRRQQDGRFGAIYVDGDRRRKIDFRVSIIPGLYGEECVIRILDPDRFSVRLDEIGMAPDMLARYRKLIHFPNGMLLVTGPTGSGKTTTLYCTIRELESKQLKILTVEDPVEYEFEKVNQKSITGHMGFADYLRAFLRQNADIILVGEIRDADTAEVAIRAATTGHLILSTLHTKDAVGAVARLRVLGVSDDFLSSTLIGVVAQRLVRRTCGRCRVRYDPPMDLVLSYYRAPPEHGFFRGAGCEHCGGSGYRGMIGIFELFVPDEELAAMIAGGASTTAIRQAALGRGYAPLVEDALVKVRDGLTTLEEIARRVPPKYL